MSGGLGLFLCMTATAPGEPSPQAELTYEAEQTYRTGLTQRDDPAKARAAFRVAAADYEQLWAGAHREVGVARNMAQAYLFAGDLANAIRVYRLGLRLEPSNQPMQEGLAYARSKVPYPRDPELVAQCRPVEGFSLHRMFKPEDWHFVAGVAYLIACLSFARGWMTNRARWWWLGLTALVLAAGMKIAWDREANRARNSILEDRPAVLTAETPLRRGNGFEYPTRFANKLPAGVEVHVVGERGGWTQVRLSGGAVGWVEKAVVLPIDPP